MKAFQYIFLKLANPGIKMEGWQQKRNYSTLPSFDTMYVKILNTIHESTII